MLPSSSLQIALQNGSLARLRLVLSTWRLLGAKLTRSWRQVGLICLLLASRIATSWPTKRQSRETAVSLAILYRFPSRLGTNFMQSGGNVGRTWLELGKLTTKAALSGDCRLVGQLVATSEAEVFLAPTLVQAGANLRPNWGTFHTLCLFQFGWGHT